MRSRVAVLGMALAAGMASALGRAGVDVVQAETVRGRRDPVGDGYLPRSMLEGLGARLSRPGKPGTVAQDKRRALKAKRRARHRMACRG